MGSKNQRFQFLNPLFGGEYVDKVLGYSPIAYWPLWEASGSQAEDLSGNAYHGTYAGVALGHTGIGDGHTCPWFDGANGDYVDIYSANFAAAFDGAEFTAMIWAKVHNAGVWTDGTNRNSIHIKESGANFHFYLRRSPTNDQLRFNLYINEAANEGQLFVDHGGDLNWMCWAYTRSEAADEVKCFVNGSEITPTITSLQAWDGSPPSTTATLIGDKGTWGGNQVWHGWLAHAAIWGTPLTPAQVADLAVV